jgi:hypothetical protein
MEKKKKMKLSNNSVAQGYNALQNSVDWMTASTSAQHRVLLSMRSLLETAENHTPIFDFCCNNSRQAWEQLQIVNSRITRLIEK